MGVVSANGLGQLAAIEGASNDLHADAIVSSHDLPFFVGQRTRLKQDMIRHTDLADVMQ